MIDYKEAGVDIAAGNELVSRIKSKVKSTFSDNVLTDLGGFAGLYDLKNLVNNYSHPVLVQSIDGLGTKPTVAQLANQYDQLGYDLLSATANDILVMGAKPLTLLDYIASAKLDIDIAETIINSLSKACQAHHVSLVGGETAEMPGVYQPGEVDIVGIVTGIVDKTKIINGQTITPGDKIYGIASSGLHTNGYSLARKLLFEVANLSIDDKPKGFETSLGNTLLKAHINYSQLVHHLLDSQVAIHGMAHITGGGLLENIPRILPANAQATLDTSSWPQQPLFELLAQLSQLPNQELYRTFNMGIGYIIVIPANASKHLEQLANELPNYRVYPIGEITSGHQKVKLL